MQNFDFTHPDILVIGSGPAGLTSAIFAARKGKKVTVIESLNNPARKLLSSGGGKCNISNASSIEDFSRAFGKSSRFTVPALHKFVPQMHRFFASIGTKLFSPDGFHLYPETQKSSDVLNAILGECNRLSVKIVTNCTAKSLIIKNNQIFGAGTNLCEFRTGKIILATGGKSWGGSTSGYDLAKSANHTVTELFPALVELYCKEAWIGELAGVSMEDVKINVPHTKIPPSYGEFLFTHKGISGPAVLNISGDICSILKKTEPLKVKVKFLANQNLNWFEIFLYWRKNKGKTKIYNLLAQYLPSSLAYKICEISSANFAEISQLTSDAQRQIIQILNEGLELTVSGSAGFEKAMLTKGGIKLSEVNSKTMESKITRGLFFAGEILDVQGPCGGYNLTWAFASACLAAESASS